MSLFPQAMFIQLMLIFVSLALFPALVRPAPHQARITSMRLLLPVFS